MVWVMDGLLDNTSVRYCRREVLPLTLSVFTQRAAQTRARLADNSEAMASVTQWESGRPDVCLAPEWLFSIDLLIRSTAE
jgi:hypothetical protein